MKRKMIALLLGASMVAAALSGCSGKKEPETETKVTTEKETEAKTEKATEAKTEETTEAETEAKTEETTEAETEAKTEEATEAETEVKTEETTEAETEAKTEETTEAETEVKTEEAKETETLAETEGVTEKDEKALTEAETEETTEAETEEATEVGTEAVTEEVTETKTEAETEETTEVGTEAVTEEVTETKTEAETEEATEVGTEAVTEEVTEIKTEAETEEATETETEAVTEAETETEAVTEKATETEGLTEEETAAETEGETEALTEAETEVETEAETEAGTEAAEDLEYVVALPEDEAVTGTVEDLKIDQDDIVVLFNNDVHGGISNHEDYSGSSESLGYAGMAAVKETVLTATDQVTTVDLGDAIQGSVVCTESNGQDVMELMDKIGYDICIPGNHEFDYGMEEFLSYAESSAADFLSCNFIDLESGESIFDGYKVVTYDVGDQELNVGYVAMSTPETIAKSTPTYFQDADGNYIYGFNADTPEDLYDCVQDNVDAALADGADMIVALGHMGDTGVESDWSSLSVIANTTGIDVFLDGHSHSTIPGELVANEDGEEVLLASTGTKLENIGVLKLSVEDGEVAAATGLVNELTKEQLESDSYKEVSEMVDEIESQYAYLFEKVGEMDFDMVINDPKDPEHRLIRVAETNLGDFLTDAYRIQSGADIAFLNGGSIRADIAAGDIVYMDLVTVMPWNSETGVIEVTGQQVLDCLEMGAHLYPEECGGFIQTSGLTYTIDTTIPSSVEVNSDGEFVSVKGEYRVKDVKVGEEDLDLEKTYTLAINKYYAEEAGDGMTMFKGSKVISPAEGEDWLIDHDVVIDYLKSMDGKVSEEYADPYGQGRIKLILEDVAEAAEVQDVKAETEKKEEAVKETETEEETEEETEAQTEVLEALSEETTETETAAETEKETEAKAEAQETETAAEVVTEAAETETETTK